MKGHKYEADWNMLNRLRESINKVSQNAEKTPGVNLEKVMLFEGEHYYMMDVFYASLLADHIEQQLKAMNVIDVQLFSRIEWYKIKEELQKELEINN